MEQLDIGAMCDLHQQSLHLDQWKKGFTQRKLDTTQLKGMSHLKEDKRFLDIVRIIEHYNKEQDSQTKSMGNFNKANLIFKIEQLLNTMTHNTCDLQRQKQLIRYAHAWAFNQMTTYDIYKEILPKSPLEDISEFKNVRQFIN